MKLEKRTGYFHSKFRASESESEDKLFLEGYFIRYGEETELFEGVYEEVRPGAGKKSLEENDIRCLFNHDTGAVLGRTSNGTLILTEDEKGVYGKVEINREDPQAMSVYAKVQRGDIDGCSFGFYINQDSSEARDDGNGMKFYLEEVDVFEVSCVTFPAYPQTDIAARFKDVETLRKQNLERQKQKLKERLSHGN